jgi:hypothetical protein
VIVIVNYEMLLQSVYPLDTLRHGRKGRRVSYSR